MEFYNEQFFNDSMKKLTDWQAQAYEPVRKMGESSANAFEKYSKLSYAALGDMVEFYVDQAHMMASTTDYKAYYENQQTAISQLNTVLSARAGEFVDLATDLQHEAKEVVTSSIKQAKKPTAAPKKAAVKKDA